jgi:hypothetical protein
MMCGHDPGILVMLTSTVLIMVMLRMSILYILYKE